MRKPLASLVAVILIASLLLVSCGPAMTPVGSETSDGGEVFKVALPRIIIDFDSEGTASIQGIDLNQLAALTGTTELTSMRLKSFYLDWMKAANVQHIEVRQAGNGLILLVNGNAMPYVGWNDASLQQASLAASVVTDLFMQQTGLPKGASALPSPASESYSADMALIGRFMPIVRRLGLDLVLRFPRQPGVAEIPLADPQKVANLKAAPSGQPASLVLQFEVKYDQNGLPAILGITPIELVQRGIALGATNLSAGSIQVLQRYNIQNVELRGKDDGLYVYVNGQPLPNIVWDDAILNNASQVYGQMNDQKDPQIQAVTQLLPLVNRADVAVLVHFPVPKGVTLIPARMH